MISANELRIGNLVICPDVSDRIYSVCAIQAKTFYCAEKIELISNDGGGIDNAIPNPIPLTEEWLVKLGFGNKQVYKYYLGEFSFWFGCGNVERFGHLEINSIGLNVGLKNIEYVHQLQNLYFALTGEELTIK